jgi:Flp pilus assembly protein TadB
MAIMAIMAQEQDRRGQVRASERQYVCICVCVCACVYVCMCVCVCAALSLSLCLFVADLGNLVLRRMHWRRTARRGQSRPLLKSLRTTRSQRRRVT